MDDQRDYVEEQANRDEIRNEQISEYFGNEDEIHGTDQNGHKWTISRFSAIGMYQLSSDEGHPFLAISYFWTLYELSGKLGITWS